MSDGVLASWNEGTAKTAVLDFVRRATTEGPDFVPAADRIATFDNDGTLWVEKPAPPQFDFCGECGRRAPDTQPESASAPLRAPEPPSDMVGNRSPSPYGDPTMHLTRSAGWN